MCATLFYFLEVYRVRHSVSKCVESFGHYPKPGDLGVDRMKRGESCVEVRRRY